MKGFPFNITGYCAQQHNCFTFSFLFTSQGQVFGQQCWKAMQLVQWQRGHMGLTLWSCYACLSTATVGSVESVHLWVAQCWILHVSLQTLFFPLRHFLSFWEPQLTPQLLTNCTNLLASTILALLRATLYLETMSPFGSGYFIECTITITDLK